jgi:chemotaxis family two-component system response regulator Rcp1
MLPILIVDDARDDLLLTETVLRQCGFLNPVHFMTSGEECVRYFRGQWRSKDGAHPARSLVFLDLNMHPLTGVDVLREIRNEPLFEQSVVVMLSGVSDMRLVQQGYQLGALTFLMKPLCQDDATALMIMMRTRIHSLKQEEGIVLAWRAEANKSLRHESHVASA